jgi:hypothetical protein
MYMISLSTRRSLACARAVLALAALGVALTACADDDAPVAPQSPAPTVNQSVGNGALVRGIGTGAVVLTLKDNTWQTPLGGGTFTLKNGTTLIATVTDNVAPDQDMTVGTVKLIGLPAGIDTLCQTVAPPKYMLPDPPMRCTPLTVVSNGTNYGSGFYDVHIPIVTWSVVDPVNNLVGGAWFQLYDSTNTVIQQITDNSGKDLDGTPGKTQFELPTKGYYTVCEQLAPSGYFPATPSCKKFWASGGLNPQNVGTFVNNPTYSVYFNVTDLYGNPLANTKFVVKRAYYVGQDINVSDNFVPDRDPKTGKYFVIVPAAGYYVICQHEAPYGYDIPTVNGGCYPYAANVKAGTPTNGGTFVDTPWPVPR